MKNKTEHTTTLILEIALLNNEINININNLVKVHLNELDKLRLKQLNIWNGCHMSYVICHISGVWCHMSPVTLKTITKC